MEIRHYLHAHPELSGNEINTRQFIVDFLKEHNANAIFEQPDNNAVMAVFNGSDKGRNVAFRCDIDALPINETNDVAYKSVNTGVAHKCGHDGHTAILLKVAQTLSQHRPAKGNVILVFQPEEETGKGAAKIVKSGKLDELDVDMIFGFHNIPAFPWGEIITNDTTFAAASCGFIANIQGRQTHAAHPENGLNPALAVAEMITFLNDVNVKSNDIEHFRQATLIYTRIGSIAFGTSAGDADVMATLRTFTNTGMTSMVNIITEKFNDICKKHHLQVKYNLSDEFPAVENDLDCVKLIKRAAIEKNHHLTELKEPFRWSEDFSQYLTKHKGAFFGIGAGENCPELHNPGYDFPDEIVDVGSNFCLDIFNLAQQP